MTENNWVPGMEPDIPQHQYNLTAKSRKVMEVIEPMAVEYPGYLVDGVKLLAKAGLTRLSHSTLVSLVNKGLITKVKPGVYRLPDLPTLERWADESRAALRDF